MARINNHGYVERITSSKAGRKSAAVYRNWWLVTASEGKNAAPIQFTVTLPPEYIGQKIRFKVELLK